MKNLELLHKGNTNTMLTVTPSRITIKFKSGLSEAEESRVQTFLIKVAEELEETEFSMRGTLQDTWRITMKSDGKAISKTFSETAQESVNSDLETLIAEFSEAHPEYATQMGATDKCYQASSEFLDFAVLRGFTNLHMDEAAVINDIVHRVANVNGVLFDWTARQFNPNAAWPLIMPEDISQDRVNELLGLT